MSILLISAGAKAYLSMLPIADGLSRVFIGTAVFAETKKDLTEYDFKAAFIYNFTKFIVWPEKNKTTDTPDTTSQPRKPEDFVICILGDNPFGDAFKPVLEKKVDGRKIRVVEAESFQKFQTGYKTTAEAIKAYRLKHAETLFKSHFLFLCDSEKAFLKELLAMFGGHPVVTIGDTRDFAKQGGMFGFVVEDNKMRFEINLSAARKENINIRSQLLQIAKQVYQ